jgi:hypothetical protein
MTTLRIFIEMNNAAFEEGDRQYETARILRDAAHRIEFYDEFNQTLYDGNGNRVGEMEEV